MAYQQDTNCTAVTRPAHVEGLETVQDPRPPLPDPEQNLTPKVLRVCVFGQKGFFDELVNENSRSSALPATAYCGLDPLTRIGKLKCSN